MSEIRVDTKVFKGKPVLEIVEFESEFSDKFVRLSFGLKKAKLIIANIEKIKEFIKVYDRESEILP